jgi:hypothetical protein
MRALRTYFLTDFLHNYIKADEEEAKFIPISHCSALI